MRNHKIERKNKMQLNVRPKLTQYYEKNNPELVDKVDVVLQLFDGRHDGLDTKLKHACGSSHALYDIAIADDNTNKLAIDNALF